MQIEQLREVSRSHGPLHHQPPTDRRVVHDYFGWSDPLDIGPYKSWVCGMIVHDYHGKGLFGGSYHSETASSNHHRSVVCCPNYPTAPISLWFLVSSQLFFRVTSKAWPVPDQSRITNPDRGQSPATGAICSAGMISPFAQIHFIYNIMQHILLFSATALLLIPAYNQFALSENLLQIFGKCRCGFNMVIIWFSHQSSL
jgi:hypothetical protein